MASDAAGSAFDTSDRNAVDPDLPGDVDAKSIKRLADPL